MEHVLASTREVSENTYMPRFPMRLELREKNEVYLSLKARFWTFIENTVNNSQYGIGDADAQCAPLHTAKHRAPGLSSHSYLPLRISSVLVSSVPSRQSSVGARIARPRKVVSTQSTVVSLVVRLRSAERRQYPVVSTRRGAHRASAKSLQYSVDSRQ